MATLTLRVPDELNKTLERQSAALGLSKIDLAREALKRNLKVTELRTLQARLVARAVQRARHYEYADWRIGASLHQDHHIEVGRAYYPVHYTLVGQRVDARLTADAVEIFQRGALIAAHPWATRRNQRMTIEAHRPPEHRAYLQVGIDQLLVRAERVGPTTREILERQLCGSAQPIYPKQPASKLSTLTSPPANWIPP